MRLKEKREQIPDGDLWRGLMFLLSGVKVISSFLNELRDLAGAVDDLLDEAAEEKWI